MVVTCNGYFSALTEREAAGKTIFYIWIVFDDNNVQRIRVKDSEVDKLLETILSLNIGDYVQLSLSYYDFNTANGNIHGFSVVDIHQIRKEV